MRVILNSERGPLCYCMSLSFAWLCRAALATHLQQERGGRGGLLLRLIINRGWGQGGGMGPGIPLRVNRLGLVRNKKFSVSSLSL